MKKLPLFLAISLVCSSLAACGGDSSSSQDTSSQTDTTLPESTEAAEWINPGVDYKGAEFTFLDYDTDNYFWQAASYSDIKAEEEMGEPINDAQYRRNRAVEEALNIKLVSLRGGDNTSSRKLVPNITQSVLAGDDEIDVAFAFMAETKTLLGEEDYIIDLNTLPGFDINASWWDQKAVNEFTLGGELKLLVGDLNLYTTFASQVFYYSKTIADEYKINDLYSLVKSGEWTVDKYFEYAHLVASDLDGDGKMGENDRYGAALDGGSMADMFVASDVPFIEKNAAGDDIKIVLNSERTVNVYNKYVGFLNDGETNLLIDAYRNKGYGNIYYELQLPTFQADRALFFPNQVLISFELRSMNTDFGVLPYPKFDTDQKEYFTPISESWATVTCVPTTNSCREMTANVLNAMGYHSQQTVTPAFIETTVFSKTLRDEESAELLRDALNSKLYDIAGIYDWGTINSSLYWMGEREENFASSYAAIESSIKAELEKTLEQLNN